MEKERHWTRTRVLVAALVATICIAGVVVVSWPAIQHAHNMAQAEAHVPLIQQALKGNTKYTEVQVLPFTGNGGCILVRGTVPNSKDTDGLERLIESTQPPVSILYDLNRISP